MKRGCDKTIVKSLIDTFSRAENNNRHDFRTKLLLGARTSVHKQIAIAILMRDGIQACRLTETLPRMMSFDVQDLIAYCDGLGLQWSLGGHEQAPLSYLLGDAA